ncbi:putative transporter [Clostridium sp. CAG:505]|nr:putative transporter [Clostridium sp. CAG:505]
MNQLFTMIILMLVGVILNKKKYLSENDAKELSVILVKVAVPANMIILLQRPYSHEIFVEFLKVCAGTLGVCFIATILFYVVGKWMKMALSSATLFACCGAYSNIIFMRQPLIKALYGEKGLIFCVAVMFVSTLYLFTICSILLSLGTDKMKDSAKVLKDSFLNLVFISGTIGFICFAKSIVLPKIISDALQFSANTTVCLSMIYIGFLLAEANLKEVMKDKEVYIFCILSLIITPIIAKAFGGLFLEGMPLAVLVILMGTPAGALLPSFVESYGKSARRASQYVFMSTILSLITQPLVAEFLCRS